MKLYEVWSEGFSANGEHGSAIRLIGEVNDKWEGEDFQKACENALISLKWDMHNYISKHNIYWGCRFFDNEADARKSFG